MSSKSASWYSNVNPSVFLSTVMLIGVFLAIVILAPNSFDLITQQLNRWVTDSFSWFYVLSVAIFLILLIYIAISDMGKIKLGPDHSLPSYSNASWFAMLFTAGMGIGLMFFGVAEPVITMFRRLQASRKLFQLPSRPCASPFSTGACMPGPFTP